tara:strand:- start:670 stop:954 length:285 start_codon:yes stop_codon:yes gene_type:complete
MNKGYFTDNATKEIVNDEFLENELPEIFLFDNMKEKQYPKLAYLTLLGKISCAGSSYIDRGILDIILYENELYSHVIYYLCTRYTFHIDRIPPN